MNQRIINVLESVLGLKGISDGFTRKDCEKWDSMAHLNIIIELEDEFGVYFLPDEISKMNSVSSIAAILEKKNVK